MTTAHTPGPWNAATRNTHKTDAGVELVCITVMPTGGYRGPIAELQSCDHIHGITTAECEANARLIAAAPDLLEALQVLVENGGIGPEQMFHDARAAIAKATSTP